LAIRGKLPERSEPFLRAVVDLRWPQAFWDWLAVPFKPLAAALRGLSILQRPANGLG
jgi:hypothetical protein